MIICLIKAVLFGSGVETRGLRIENVDLFVVFDCSGVDNRILPYPIQESGNVRSGSLVRIRPFLDPLLSFFLQDLDSSFGGKSLLL